MNKHNEELLFAIDASGNFVSIENIPPERRGKKCGCICPKCKAGLYAKLGSGELNGRKPHFAHESGSDCHGAGMTILHILAEKIIEEEKAVMAPSYKCIPPEKLHFKEVEIEKRADRPDLQPDIVGITEDGLRFHIEIKNTSIIKENKKAKLLESNFTCLEIDVSEQIQDKDKLRDFLLNSTESREWINNPIYDKRIEEIRNKENAEEKKRVEELRKKEEAERAELKRKLLPYDETKYDFRDGSYCRSKCECYNYGCCAYQVNKFSFHDSTIVVCDKESKIKDQENKRTKRSIISIDDKKEIQPYLNICVKGLSLYDIIYKIKKEELTIKIDEHNVNAIEKINISGLSDGIVFFCKCDDRVYPYKVVTAWLENEKLRYKIVCNRKMKSYDDANRIYEAAILTAIKIDQIDQDNVLEKDNWCVF